MRRVPRQAGVRVRRLHHVPRAVSRGGTPPAPPRERRGGRRVVPAPGARTERRGGSHAALIEVLQSIGVFLGGIVARFGVFLAMIAVLAVPALIAGARHRAPSPAARARLGLRSVAGVLFRPGLVYAPGHTWLAAAHRRRARARYRRHRAAAPARRDRGGAAARRHAGRARRDDRDAATAAGARCDPRAGPRRGRGRERRGACAIPAS